jgi:hypothetical protein
MQKEKGFAYFFTPLILAFFINGCEKSMSTDLRRFMGI